MCPVTVHRDQSGNSSLPLLVVALWPPDALAPQTPTTLPTTGSRKHHSMALLLTAARAGWLVATIDYRLAPGVAFPHMLLDW